MPGYFEAVVATHVLLNNTILTIQQLITQIQTVGSKGIVIVNQAQTQNLMAENHSAGTPGPITAGYAADVPQGPGRGKNWNVDTEITAPPPSTASGIIFSMRSTLTADAAAASYSMIQAMRNPTIHQLGNRFPHHCKVQFLAGAIDQDDQFDWIILPLAPGARTINHYVEWPNVGAPIANTAVQFDYRGYLT